MTVILVAVALAVGFVLGRARRATLIDWAEDWTAPGWRTWRFWAAAPFVVLALAWVWTVHPRRTLANFRAWRRPEPRGPALTFDPDWATKRRAAGTQPETETWDVPDTRPGTTDHTLTDRLRCPQCSEDITDYSEDDHVFRTQDDRPYCSGECVIAAHRATEARPETTASADEECCDAEPPATGTWGDCWCTLPPGHTGEHRCQPCTDRHGAPGWTDETQPAAEARQDGAQQ
ncbi:hypothetical protein ACH4UY_04785 [Streptomyces longwoodensis]|uniref:hypothetical protein n=1 Tax=Streptomyces longwoodensis TaxID=68231 RepID=UPI0037BCDEA5